MNGPAVDPECSQDTDGGIGRIGVRMGAGRIGVKRGLVSQMQWVITKSCLVDPFLADLDWQQGLQTARCLTASVLSRVF